MHLDVHKHKYKKSRLSVTSMKSCWPLTKAGSPWTTVVLWFQLNAVETMLAETMTVVETKTKTITNRSTLAETKTMTNTNKWQ